MAGVGKAVLFYLTLLCPCLGQPVPGPVQLHIHLEGGQEGQQGESEGEGQGGPLHLYLHMDGGQGVDMGGQDGEGEDYQAQPQSKGEVKENLEKKVQVSILDPKIPHMGGTESLNVPG